MRQEALIPKVGVVTDIRQDTPDVKTFRVVGLDGNKLFEHMPGQCAMVSIPGIGETRAKALMKHFTTIRAVSEATEEMLEETPGMNAPAARAVYRYFHSEENDGE